MQKLVRNDIDEHRKKMREIKFIPTYKEKRTHLHYSEHALERMRSRGINSVPTYIEASPHTKVDDAKNKKVYILRYPIRDNLVLKLVCKKRSNCVVTLHYETL